MNQHVSLYKKNAMKLLRTFVGILFLSLIT